MTYFKIQSSKCLWVYSFLCLMSCHETHVYLQFSPSELRCFLLVDSVRAITTSAEVHVFVIVFCSGVFGANLILLLLNEPLRSPWWLGPRLINVCLPCVILVTRLSSSHYNILQYLCKYSE